ncbi:MAG: hypothetical protein COV37_07665 [Bdellovibrio sp. CG11_big_fil_rev_8_21_14_0_20_39_38]|nr:MAG: hypothetical protein COW78_19730 [Bdellovibrio sp. CG22_combo_CG10-13_8_21_14_all_39_27]PIR35600.1 MAG: hypothetical protein COV37_07665 [Bdellovibrio sp. CG11_big_fil_rev_8_21_14_0_20_39_38]
MKYLSFDIEATGLNSHDLIIEIAYVPFDTETLTLEDSLAGHFFIQCPSFEDLKPGLDPWVIEHNQTLIETAHSKGLPIQDFKVKWAQYLESAPVREYFKDYKKVTLFGKSMSAIDLPFLNRDLGWDWMRKYFEHRQLDLSSVAYNLIDLNIMPAKCMSGSELMKYLGMGDVAHTALEDARNTALMYFEIIKRFKK